MNIPSTITIRLGGQLGQALFGSALDAVRFRDEIARLAVKVSLSEFVTGRYGAGARKRWIRGLYPIILAMFAGNGGCSGDYSDRSDYGDCLDVGPFRLPTPDEADVDDFLHSFGEMVAPHLWPRRSWQWLGKEGVYERFGASVEPGDIVLDVGANAGMFSALAASRGACVYAFEPLPDAIRYLERTIAANSHLQGTITSVPLAVTDRSGKVEMTYDAGRLAGASAVGRSGRVSYRVSATTIDEWVAATRLPRVDFIKADVEGAERLLVAGATSVLRRFRPKLAICTYHKEGDAEALRDAILAANPAYVVRQGKYKLHAQ